MNQNVRFPVGAVQDVHFELYCSLRAGFERLIEQQQKLSTRLNMLNHLSTKAKQREERFLRLMEELLRRIMRLERHLTADRTPFKAFATQ